MYIKGLLTVLAGAINGLKWWGKRKEKKKREKALDAVVDSKRYDDMYK